MLLIQLIQLKYRKTLKDIWESRTGKDILEKMPVQRKNDSEYLRSADSLGIRFKIAGLKIFIKLDNVKNDAASANVIVIIAASYLNSPGAGGQWAMGKVYGKNFDILRSQADDMKSRWSINPQSHSAANVSGILAGREAIDIIPSAIAAHACIICG